MDTIDRTIQRNDDEDPNFDDLLPGILMWADCGWSIKKPGAAGGRLAGFSA